jgi:pyrroline-5-carboxylate reductase
MSAASPDRGLDLRQFSGTLVLVGAGKMGGALLDGWLGLGLDPKHVVVLEPQPSLEIASLAIGGVQLNPDIKTLHDVAAIIIAVKPQVASEIVPGLAPLIGPATVVVSIMAGRTLRFLGDALPTAPALVRAMPNTPASIGRELFEKSA